MEEWSGEELSSGEDSVTSRKNTHPQELKHRAGAEAVCMVGVWSLRAAGPRDLGGTVDSEVWRSI